jgi:acyl-CoA thioesterase FadM
MLSYDDVRATRETMSLRITPELCDINGHFTVRHQVGVHDDAAWDLLGTLGMGIDQVAHGASFFDVEQHLRYLAEAVSGEVVSAHHRLLDVSSSSVHFMSYLVLPDRAAIVSTFECLLLAVDLGSRGMRRFSADELERLIERTLQDRALGWDAGACGAMGVRRSALAD